MYRLTDCLQVDSMGWTTSQSVILPCDISVFERLELANSEERMRQGPPHRPAGDRAPPGQRQWVDFVLLRRTIQRQLSPKRPLTAVAAAVEPASGPLFTKHSATVGLMRIADIADSSRAGGRSVHAGGDCVAFGGSQSQALKREDLIACRFCWGEESSRFHSHRLRETANG